MYLNNPSYFGRHSDTYSTTVIAKIKGMLRLLFYDIPRYVTIGSEKLYTYLSLSHCEKICAFEVKNLFNNM